MRKEVPEEAVSPTKRGTNLIVVAIIMDSQVNYCFLLKISDVAFSINYSRQGILEKMKTYYTLAVEFPQLLHLDLKLADRCFTTNITASVLISSHLDLVRKFRRRCIKGLANILNKAANFLATSYYDVDATIFDTTVENQSCK